jgi:HPt (histidine-containing phosphotransfer) domain-containing protein
MDPLINRERIADLDRLMNEPLGEILRELVQRIDEAIERARQALEADDLDTVAGVAHHARNDAMIVGAGPLEHVLSKLEAAARAKDGAVAGDALNGVEHAWSMTRPELEDAARTA